MSRFVGRGLWLYLDPHSSAGVVAEEPVLERDLEREPVIARPQLADGNLGPKTGVAIRGFVGICPALFAFCAIGGRIIAPAESYENLIDLALSCPRPSIDSNSAAIRL